MEIVGDVGIFIVEELDLAFSNVTDKGLDMLHFACPSLRKLTLAQQQRNNWSSAAWSEEGLERFKRRRPDVEVILSPC